MIYVHAEAARKIRNAAVNSGASLQVNVKIIKDVIYTSRIINDATKAAEDHIISWNNLKKKGRGLDRRGQGNSQWSAGCTRNEG